MVPNRSAQEVSVSPAGPQDKAILQNMSQFWHYDFSAILGADLGADGSFGSRGFNRLLKDAECFLIRANRQLAGFAYISRSAATNKIDRFFIMRKYRRRGVGEAALRQLFGLESAKWQLTVRPQNTGALKFWRYTLAKLCDAVQEDEERLFADGIARIEFKFRPAAARPA